MKIKSLLMLATAISTLSFTTAPTRAGSEPFLGEIMAVGFAYCPRGWVEANGQLVSVSQNSSLFSLFGTFYGGDGRATFGIPDLRGRMVMHYGTGIGLSPRRQGQILGQERVTLSASEIPSHSHTMRASTATSNTNSPAGAAFGEFAAGASIYENTTAPSVSMNSATIGRTGGGQAHDNMPPAMVLRYCVATDGVYPPRN